MGHRSFLSAVRQPTRWLRGLLLVMVAGYLPWAVVSARVSPPAGKVTAPPVFATTTPPTLVSTNVTASQSRSPAAHLTFSAQPTDAEFFRARLFSEPLLPIGGRTTAAENAALAHALVTYATASQPEDVEPVLTFLQEHRDTPWRGSLLVNLGDVYQRTGYSTRALAAWDASWKATKNATDISGRAVADRALAEWLTLALAQGKVTAVRQRLHDTSAREVRGTAESKIRNVYEQLSLLTHHTELLVPAEQRALERLAAYTHPIDATHAPHLTRTSSRLPETGGGRSWFATARRALRLGLSLRPATRSATARIVAPSLVRLRAGHAVAVLDVRDERLLVYDPLLGEERWIASKALRKESSTTALIRTGDMPEGWAAGDSTAMVFGGMCPPGPPEDNTPPRCPTCGGPGGSGPGGGGGAAPPGGGGSPEGGEGGEENSDCGTGPCTISGLAEYRLNRLTAGLLVEDTPVGYRPPLGPGVFFHVRYNQRAAFLPDVLYFSNLGPKWTHDWLSYVEDLPVSCGAGGSGGDCAPAYARVILRGGGYERYLPSGPTTYSRHWRSAAELVRTSESPLRFERRLRDGSVEVFGLSDGTPTGQGWPRVFLTEITDRRGQSVHLTYDSQFRLTAITDVLGQVTTIAYELPSDPLKITKVTDPFGRFATFTYNATGELASMTDVIGLTASFLYNGDFLTSLVTPYGTTTFRKETNWQTDPFIRRMDAIDPLGAVERVEYHTTSDSVPESVPSTEVPTGFDDFNGALNQFVSLYWDKRAMSLAPDDPQAAVVTSWLTENNFNHTWRGVNVPRYVKRPLEGRVWYAYPNQDPLSGEVGTWTRPAAVARVLDDGTSQIWQTTYNDHGVATSQTDPLGRRTSYIYADNQIDLLEVRQTTGSLNDLLTSFGNYTPQHQPQTITDAAGQTSTMTYNANGQLLTSTNSKNETTTYTYDTNGYVHQVDDAIVGARTSFTYDEYGRIRSVTDADGYIVTTTYDALNRPIRTTYPDGTYEQVIYANLDVAERRDRLGRITRKFHDAVRHLTTMRDALGRTFTQRWCVCGSLDAFVDGNGHQTQWERDLQGRTTREVRADGITSTGYTYETKTARVKMVQDPAGQNTTYTYNTDDTIQHVDYTQSAIATPSVSFTYDTSYNRLATMVDGAGTTTYAYKPIGTPGATQLASIDGPLDDDTITYDYDELGRVVTRSVNGAANWTSETYDPLGRVLTEVNPLGTFTFGYDGPTTRLASVTYPNGQTATYGYFGNLGDHRLQTIHHKYQNGATLSKFDYTYDNVGNIVTWIQQTNDDVPVEWSYTYDSVDQLLKAVKSTTGTTPNVLRRYAYTYDLAGNRLTEQIDDSVITSVYDALNRLISQQPGGALRVAGTVSEPATITIQGRPANVTSDNRFEGAVPVIPGNNNFTVSATDATGNSSSQTYQVSATGAGRAFVYDSNGNLTSDGQRTYAWDAANRLIAINQGTGAVQLSYNGHGQPFQIMEAGTTQRLVWCLKEICEERTSAGIQRLTNFGLNDSSSGNSFIVRDHLGSVIARTDDSVNVQSRAEYEPFGEILSSSGNIGEFGFGGYRALPNWHVNLTWYRAYMSSIGRWLSEDPVGLDGGVNLYAYVSNSVLNATDPSGLLPMGLGCTFKTMLVTAYCDNGPGRDWQYYKPLKDGDPMGSVGPGTVAVANANPKPYCFGTKFTIVQEWSSDPWNWQPQSDYSGEAHDTGAGWDAKHHNTKPDEWIDIWLPCKEAKQWGKQWRWVMICPSCNCR
jgi:RHS repeat-associated protein